ncbi:hypothetical protein QFC20_003149 [Naganishia adeliensis]|uniref:Uncharacterized protein n=1 Tax=Naganishia adeliensis TaxID=92952 RepID=A0ACC2WFI7_9TREE|nr:hypothetical protein QFC20_003149 [Naganishia adeliensis]
MFWRYGFDSTSSLDTLLNRVDLNEGETYDDQSSSGGMDDGQASITTTGTGSGAPPTVEELLEEQELLNELKVKNPKCFQGKDRDVEEKGEDVDMDEKEEEGPLTRMKRERAFANANVVVVPPPINDKAPPKPPTLDEILFVHPSRAGGKSAWKERRTAVKGQGRRIVQYPRYYSSFTPSFAPTHDSSSATNGFGYYQTWEAGMGKAAVHSWLTSGWNGTYGSEFIPEEETAQIEDFRPRATKDDIEDLLKSLMEKEIEIDPTLVDAVDEAQGEMRDLQRKLDQNAVWVRQLQQFQEIRLHRGQREPLEEEERIAQRLQQSLVELASATTPAALLPQALRETEEPIAIVLARKVIHTPAPNVRGTLDPTRPKALSDNTTAVARAPDQVAPPIARPPPVSAPRTQMRPNQQWQPGPQKVPGPPQAAGYNTPQAMQARGGRYAFPPQSTPGLQGRSSPIAPINSMPSVLRNTLPQPVGLGSFSPMGRSTLTPGSGTYAPGQGGRGIGSAMGMSMNNPGMNGSPVPAFRPSNSMRG